MHHGMPTDAKRAVSVATFSSSAAIRVSAAFALVNAVPVYANMNSACVWLGGAIWDEPVFAKVTPNSMKLSCAMGAAFNFHSCLIAWFVLD